VAGERDGGKRRGSEGKRNLLHMALLVISQSRVARGFV
jgi:hypothetical protein